MKFLRSTAEARERSTEIICLYLIRLAQMRRPWAKSYAFAITPHIRILSADLKCRRTPGITPSGKIPRSPALAEHSDFAVLQRVMPEARCFPRDFLRKPAGQLKETRSARILRQSRARISYISCRKDHRHSPAQAFA